MNKKLFKKHILHEQVNHLEITILLLQPKNSNNIYNHTVYSDQFLCTYCSIVAPTEMNGNSKT